MNPSELSKALRRIASRIESSKTPSRALVAADIRKVIASIGPLWVTVLPAENQALVFQTKEEAGQAATEHDGAIVCEAGQVGVIVFTEGYDVRAEPASELPIMGTEEVAEMAEGNAETVWFDTRTALPGDTLEPFATTHPPVADPGPATTPEEEPAADGDEDDGDD